ncbi:ABC transporter ATP-binding protein [Aeromicrobium chenweiae]|uniref:ABC transporter ATP-binding protein n=1 Tax=Aeromicrobium chenweiae TaxID=2079793 RepID=A0A2S0WMC2_9ACTN|nr:ATP-binding cassette domain-containing protein [Aeromicrobium chenweiae]AWB92461.1 ABC transporter ATP-binding protein [Aeromicrobium chenweiae]TGN31248.1 ATP-binding cassette domain-containing protein [Aeromicrobium chenweiae]
MPDVVLDVDAVDLVREQRTLLDDVSLTVRRGEHWALIGPNGAGKSTLLSLFGAVTHPTRGTVHVLGRQLGRVDMRDLRRDIGFVNPRHPLRSDLSVEEIVLTGATGTIEPLPRWAPTDDERHRAQQLMKMLGVDVVTSAHWLTMSQGERGRTLIARVLMHDPPLLLLDEPSTGLDVAAREQLLTTLDGLRETLPDTSTVMVTHHFEELPRTTTHAALIRGGRIMASGPVDEVLTTPQVSECFDHPIRVERTNGRWAATAG